MNYIKNHKRLSGFINRAGFFTVVAFLIGFTSTIIVRYKEEKQKQECRKTVVEYFSEESFREREEERKFDKIRAKAILKEEMTQDEKEYWNEYLANRAFFPVIDGKMYYLHPNLFANPENAIAAELIK